MKFKDKNDSIRKVSLIDDLSMGISYNTAAQVRPWSDLSFNLRLKLSKSYTLSMSSTFATYAYEFDENGRVVPGNRTEWSYGRFGRWSGYGTSFSWTVNNDSWKKIRNFFTGQKDDEEQSQDQNASTEEDGDMEGETTEDGTPKKKKEKAAADADGYQVFKMPWSINFSTGFNITKTPVSPLIVRTCAIRTNSA